MSGRAALPGSKSTVLQCAAWQRLGVRSWGFWGPAPACGALLQRFGLHLGRLCLGAGSKEQRRARRSGPCSAEGLHAMELSPGAEPGPAPFPAFPSRTGAESGSGSTTARLRGRPLLCELEKSRHLAVASSEMGQWNKNIFLDWYKELKIKKKGNVFELASQTKAVLLLAGVQRGIESSGRSCAGSTQLAGQGEPHTATEGTAEHSRTRIISGLVARAVLKETQNPGFLRFIFLLPSGRRGTPDSRG